ncbi:MAG: hypothetical protein HDQ88_04370 [Clostridia bacterium]|nr:hypothetical protein [Clostridia bacterium]
MGTVLAFFVSFRYTVLGDVIMLDSLLIVRDFVQDAWTTYRLGTICAFISMAFVFVTDVRLVKEFLRSDNRLKVWPKLLLHTVWRVLVTICAYYGPVWLIEHAWGLCLFCFGCLCGFFEFISQADRFLVILITTGVVLSVFVLATAIAVTQFGKLKLKEWRFNKCRKKESLYDRLVLRDREREKLKYLEGEDQGDG